MDKIKIITDVGYYHPSNANWSYRIHLIIDKTGARFYSSTFGGESRMKVKAEKLYAGKGSGVEWKYKDMKDLADIETYAGKNW
jgi:hypothetical protein